MEAFLISGRELLFIAYKIIFGLERFDNNFDDIIILYILFYLYLFEFGVLGFSLL